MLAGGPHRRSRSGPWFAGLLAASLLLLAVSRTEPVVAFQQATAAVLDPVRAALAGVGETAGELWGAIAEIDRLRSENQQLREALAGAEQRIAELGEAATENRALRALLGLTQSLEMDLLPVRIVSRDPSNLAWEVGIDAGSADGVRIGMPVVAAAPDGHGALAGSVVAVSLDSAAVRFTVDPRARVVGIDQATRALGLVQGQLGGQLVMGQVPLTESAAIGDLIVTAGLELTPDATSGARSPYPAGLLIGRVQAIERDTNALTQTLFVRPSLDFATLERLLVVLAFPAD